MATTVHLLPPVGAAERLGTLLSAGEAARVARFRQHEDRDAVAAAHALKRSVLSVLTGVAPRELAFAAGPAGKPALAGGGVRFNLSHCRTMAALAVSDEGEVGVDVEWLGRHVPEVARVAGAVFDPVERQRLRTLPRADAVRCFLRTFVLKEAVVKATGLGLPQGLTGFGVETDPPAIVRPGDGLGDPADWTLRLLEIDGHALAVAVRATGAPVEVVGHTLDGVAALAGLEAPDAPPVWPLSDGGPSIGGES